MAQQLFNYTNTPYGTKPEAIIQPNIMGDLSALYPNLSQTNANLSSVIGSQLKGELPQDVVNQIRDKSAGAAVAGGMPGSGLYQNRTARDLGLTSLDLINKGVANYNQTIPAISKTQTLDPSLQFEIANQNALNAAAPNPQMAAEKAQQLYDQYMNANKSPAGGGGYHVVEPSPVAGPSPTTPRSMSMGGGGMGAIPGYISSGWDSPTVANRNVNPWGGQVEADLINPRYNPTYGTYPGGKSNPTPTYQDLWSNSFGGMSTTDSYGLPYGGGFGEQPDNTTTTGQSSYYNPYQTGNMPYDINQPADQTQTETGSDSQTETGSDFMGDPYYDPSNDQE